MRRLATSLFIAAYLSSLSWGIASHALRWGNNAHPAMYYLVWDMFCGWAAYELRYHVIGEGESGKFYELSPAPWGTFSPYGDLPRHHYDAQGHTFHRIAMNTLKHTQHEPMRRILVLEEAWHKKYNLPDSLWALRFDQPKDPFSYFWLRAIYNEEGVVQTLNYDFLTQAQGLTIIDNPRLLSDAKRGRPFFAVSPQHRGSMPVHDPSAWALDRTERQLFGH